MSRHQRVHHSVAFIFPLVSLAISVGCTSVVPAAITSTSEAVSKGDASVESSVATTTEVVADSKAKRPVGPSVSPATSSTSSTTAAPSVDTPIKNATTPPSTSSTVPSLSQNPTALQVLATIAVMNEYTSGYDRSLFKHWIDANGNGCDTREEVLIAESLTPAQVDAYGCKVIEGDWYSPFDNVTHTLPGGLDIDHMVPLKEAWDSGAWAWSPLQRQLFANDLSDRRPLIAVSAGVNRSKGERDPSNWLPPNSAYTCTYLSDWVAIKAQWKLSMDQSEYGRVKNLLTASCSITTVKPWGTRRDTTGAVAPVVSPSTSSLATTSPNEETPSSGVRQVTPVRCKASEFGQTGEYNGIAYVCSDTRQNGEPYATNYYFWRPV